jgi:hypothetical protein
LRLQLQALSKSAAARQAGMSRAGLEKHIRAGRFQILPDSSVDRASFDVWLQSRPPVAPATASVDSEAAEKSRTAAALIDQGGAFATKADAERFRDSYIGRLRQIEYDRESRTVADVKDTAHLVGQEYARVRTKMLAIPAERAPQLFRCKTVAEMQDVLRDVIGRALEELTADDPGAAA